MIHIVREHHLKVLKSAANGDGGVGRENLLVNWRESKKKVTGISNECKCVG